MSQWRQVNHSTRFGGEFELFVVNTFDTMLFSYGIIRIDLDREGVNTKTTLRFVVRQRHPSSCALGTSLSQTTNHSCVVAVIPSRPWSTTQSIYRLAIQSTDWELYMWVYRNELCTQIHIKSNAVSGLVYVRFINFVFAITQRHKKLGHQQPWYSLLKLSIHGYKHNLNVNSQTLIPLTPIAIPCQKGIKQTTCIQNNSVIRMVS